MEDLRSRNEISLEKVAVGRKGETRKHCENASLIITFCLVEERKVAREQQAEIRRGIDTVTCIVFGCVFEA